MRFPNFPFPDFIEPRIMGLALLAALGACSGPIDAYRSAAGLARNDPDPETAPFSNNLAAGESAPYPNLASVPPPPTRVTTTAERQKLAASLIADRTRMTTDAGPPPPPPLDATTTGAGGKTPADAKTTVDAGANPAGAGGSNASNPADTAAVPRSALATSATGQIPSSAKGDTGKADETADRGQPRDPTKMANANQTRHRQPGEPPEPSPQDSTLQMPEVRAIPEPEATRAAPGRPAMGPATSVGPATPMPAEASVAPLPAPAVPVLSPPPAPPAAASAAAPPPTSAPPTSAPPTAPPAVATAMPAPLPAPKPVPAAPTIVATLDIAGAAHGIEGHDQAEIDRVAALYKQTPRNLRVVARAAPPVGGGDPLASYHAALGRAQAVAVALAAAGVPAAKIQTEATPAGGTSNAGRVEIQFAP